MKIENSSFAGTPVSNQPTAAENIQRDRKSAESSAADSEDLQKKVASEEILAKIKGLTEGGLYSVRFEKSKESEEIVVRVVDQESGEVIRQIPPEEVLGASKRLQELRGIIFQAKT